MKRKPIRTVEIKPNVYHILHPGNVYSTLIVGRESALLIDTGFGLVDLKAYIESVTDKPYVVVNTHGHPDHILGNPDFPYTYISKEDEALARYYVTEPMMQETKEDLVKFDAISGGEEGSLWEDTQMTFRYLEPGERFELGGISLKVVALSGHTRGSIGLLWEEERFLFAGDALNPGLWLFMEECSTIQEYRKMLVETEKLPFDSYLYSHSEDIVPKAFLKDVIDHIDSLKHDDSTEQQIHGYQTFTARYEGRYGVSEIVYGREKL